ncbi:serine/threonine-protein phosphatase 4 regulatory subunit 2-B isoform X1 [Hypomesus transpacificus]|uniref:serine/threonine-protein phosphatase 4 regulatory subunit 2-B isoform X1 n=2 Tax=Hypomesus transpacificus TaxID=137520 RepID=UPI001F0858FD|nr:serine/threonine-protein phosphatase 4 regulatory subunit 2-B isoform X1 [Hypomesus transpacificus]
MEVDSIQEALKDFEKKGKKEPSPPLDQFLCHVAKTGETMVQWSQFKSYFLFKLEKVMDDFKATAPEQRGSANSNVESIPFEDMKERILKIVNGYNGIPFTIQRLCELLTEPKRNYTGTDKFLRGVEKNVMVVSCVHPTSEKNGCSGLNRMNGVMLPGNTSAFTERKINGPGTLRLLGRPKLSLASSAATNGLPDSTENKDSTADQGHNTAPSDVSATGGALGSSVKNKHNVEEEEEDMEAEQHDVKRLKCNKEEDEDEEDDEEDDEEEEEQEADPLRTPHADSLSEEAESMVQEKEENEDQDEEEDNEAAALSTCDDQEPSSTQSEVSAGPGQGGGPEGLSEREVPCGSQEEASDMDQSEQQAPAGVLESPEASSENSDPVSSSGSSSHFEETTSEEAVPSPSSSTPETPTEGAMESGNVDTGTSDEPMEQD